MVILELHTKTCRYIISSTEGTLIYRGMYNYFKNEDGIVYKLIGVDGTYAPESVDKFIADRDIIQITLPVNNTVLIIDDKNE